MRSILDVGGSLSYMWQAPPVEYEVQFELSGFFRICGYHCRRWIPLSDRLRVQSAV